MPFRFLLDPAAPRDDLEALARALNLLSEVVRKIGPDVELTAISIRGGPGAARAFSDRLLASASFRRSEIRPELARGFQQIESCAASKYT